MPQSIVDICNRALGKLAQDVTIVSLSESSKAARSFNRSWEPVRDFVLSSRWWPFALKAQALAASTDSPLPGWTYRYAYPGDCLDALAVCDENGVRGTLQSLAHGQLDARQEFQKVYGATETCVDTDLEAAWLIYAVAVEDVNRYPPQFVEALACRLAWENAAVLAGEVGLRMRPQLLQDYEFAKNAAGVHELNESHEVLFAYTTPSRAARGGD